MTDSDLDRCYTALCEALGQAGEARAPLMLSMVCLALMARCDSADEVLPLVERARAQLAEEAANAG
jgi:hypothetical protein